MLLLVSPSLFHQTHLQHDDTLFRPGLDVDVWRSPRSNTLSLKYAHTTYSWTHTQWIVVVLLINITCWQLHHFDFFTFFLLRLLLLLLLRLRRSLRPVATKWCHDIKVAVCVCVSHFRFVCVHLHNHLSMVKSVCLCSHLRLPTNISICV